MAETKAIWHRCQKNKRHNITPIEVTVIATRNDHALVAYQRRHRVCGAIVQTKNLEFID